jgi:hypothetical protein
MVMDGAFCEGQGVNDVRIGYAGERDGLHMMHTGCKVRKLKTNIRFRVMDLFIGQHLSTGIKQPHLRAHPPGTRAVRKVPGGAG